MSLTISSWDHADFHLALGIGDQIFPAIHAMHNYPPCGFFMKHAIENLFLTGLTSLYFDSDWDKDVDRFIPERWYDDPNGHSKAGLWSNAPFGNGARRCVGERLALGEGRLATASILRKFEIVHVPEGPDTWKFVTEFAGTIKPNMVMVQLRPRATK